jgi:hypothetical protein
MVEKKIKTPQEAKSHETDSKEQKLAKDQGESFEKAVNQMGQKDPHAQKRAGDYIVVYAIEKAEGLYFLEGGKLVWKNPTVENTHIEIVVRDAADGRFIPGLDVTVTLIDQNGKEIGTNKQPFLWHPWLYHYGLDWSVPQSGNYSMKVHIDAPVFPRHDKKNGKRYAEPVDVEFYEVKVETGQKIE